MEQMHKNEASRTFKCDMGPTFGPRFREISDLASMDIFIRAG
jgi:hypothetical protein